MKKVLFFNYEYPPLGGGAANATKYILREYARSNDVSVDLITSSIGRKYHSEHIGGQITIHFLPIGKKEGQLNYQTKWQLITYTWRAYFFARKLMHKNVYDLTHSFFGVPCGVISLLIKKQYKIPYVVSLRGADVPGYSERFMNLYSILTPVIHYVWREAKYVVTNSRGLTELARKSAPEQKFLQIANGVDTHFYTPGLRTLADRKKEFRILLASRLSRRKGFNYAIDAFVELFDLYPHIRMRIAGGEGNAMEELKAQVKKYRLDGRVVFTGLYTKDQSPQIYCDADVFVMPSLNEGMSNNLLEALAAGLPVLMTPTGGAEELVRDGENGYLIKMHDVASIVEKLKILIENPEVCDGFGHASRTIAEQMSWEHVAEQYKHLYHTMS
ncbi:MAG: glycosyltransferase family 4 protein [Parcubacteria group bacterium]